MGSLHPSIEVCWLQKHKVYLMGSSPPLWITSIQYIDRPSWRLAGLAGLLVGAIVVVHGTELYTTAIVMVVLPSVASILPCQGARMRR